MATVQTHLELEEHHLRSTGLRTEVVVAVREDSLLHSCIMERVGGQLQEQEIVEEQEVQHQQILDLAVVVEVMWVDLEDLELS